MTTSDTELIEEVRQLTGYTSTDNLSDSNLQSIVDTAKDEIRSYVGDPNFTFYQRGQTSTFEADRALFWFTCIGTKIRAGEIGSAELRIDELESIPNDGAESFWHNQFWSHLMAAERRLGSSSRMASLERTARSYGEQ